MIYLSELFTPHQFGGKPMFKNSLTQGITQTTNQAAGVNQSNQSNIPVPKSVTKPVTPDRKTIKNMGVSKANVPSVKQGDASSSAKPTTDTMSSKGVTT